MLSVMEPLVSYGFYWKDSEINEIIGFLTDIVNGMHDRPYPSKDYINNIVYSLFLSFFLLSLSLYLSLGASSCKVDKYLQKIRFKATERTKKIFLVKNRLVTKVTYQLISYIPTFYCRAVRVLHLFFKQLAYMTLRVCNGEGLR